MQQIGDESRRCPAPVHLHSPHVAALQAGHRPGLHPDLPVAAEGSHHLADQAPPVRHTDASRGDRRQGLLIVTGFGPESELPAYVGRRRFDPPTQQHAARTSRHQPDALVHQRDGQHGGSCRAVSGLLGRRLAGLPHDPRANILHPVGERDCVGDGVAVPGDHGRASFAFQQNRLSTRSEGHGHRIRHAAQSPSERFASGVAESYFSRPANRSGVNRGHMGYDLYC